MEGVRGGVAVPGYLPLSIRLAVAGAGLAPHPWSVGRLAEESSQVGVHKVTALSLPYCPGFAWCVSHLLSFVLSQVALPHRVIALPLSTHPHAPTRTYAEHPGALRL